MSIPTMPAHPDAIGYIRDLGHSEGIPWLEMICDLAGSGEMTINSTDLEILVQLFTKRASYIRQSAPVINSVTATGATSLTIDRLETIGQFNGFKRLSNTLVASFPKQVTIIFGANGSGKSSLCEALQILASSNTPKRPLHDVLTATTPTPSFAYQFASDSGSQTWTSQVGYGSRAHLLKYFDNGIAIQNIKDSIQPGRIIELSPFRLDVFETAKKHCETLRAELQRREKDNATFLVNGIVQIRERFEPFKEKILAHIDNPNPSTLEAEIKLAEDYSAKSDLKEKLKLKTELEKATSEEGLKLLKGEVIAMKAFYAEFQPLLDAAESLVRIDPVAQSKILKEKEYEFEVLAKALIPKNATLDKLMALLRPAQEMCNLLSPSMAECPLCKQNLRETELKLFTQYAGLLTGDLDAVITKLRKTIKMSEKHLEVIAHSLPDDWAKDSVLTSETIDAVKKASKAIKARLKTGERIDQEVKDAVLLLKKLSKDILESLEEKNKLIEEASKNREEFLRRLENVSLECQDILYVNEIVANMDLLKKVYRRTKNAVFWKEKIPDFTSVFRKITSAAKRAHKELVVADFKLRLNGEYLALAEKDMNAFGVELKDIGGDGVVTVNPHIRDHGIETILSEGEQRIHALALFFAELQTCNQQIIVFDDPISSFDYNYISNYCNRLRNLIQDNPTRQVIIFTHNWEFFVQIQTTLNKSRLDGKTAVHVLESCVAIDEYSEDIDVLKAEIAKILSIAGEPNKTQKENMAGRMRRLIEAVVNTHIFNKQRHQFKQKNQPISTFDAFTKVMPLLLTEAQTLQDLYLKLSITEHDDPRNAYVNTDKAMFQTRYDAIKAIETAIIGRK